MIVQEEIDVKPISIFAGPHGRGGLFYRKEDVELMMRKRCESQGHDFENCCSMMFRVYMRCRWCGEEH